MAKQVLLLENIHPSAKESFEKLGFQVRAESTSFSEADLLDLLPAYDVIGIRSRTQITDGVITKVECPSPTKCREDGLYGGVAAGVTTWVDGVTVPQKGGARVTR